MLEPIQLSDVSSARRTILPLPAGEGWGEGESFGSESVAGSWREHKITKRTQIKSHNQLSINEKRKNRLASFSKTNPNSLTRQLNRGPLAPSRAVFGSLAEHSGHSGCAAALRLPTAKLTLTAKLASKTNRNKTKTNQFFHRTGSRLIHRHNHDGHSQPPYGVPRLLKPNQGCPRLLKGENKNYFFVPSLNTENSCRFRKPMEGYGRPPWGEGFLNVYPAYSGLRRFLALN
jgi:hypothetical protein